MGGYYGFVGGNEFKPAALRCRRPASTIPYSRVPAEAAVIERVGVLPTTSRSQMRPRFRPESKGGRLLQGGPGVVFDVQNFVLSRMVRNVDLAQTDRRRKRRDKEAHHSDEGGRETVTVCQSSLFFLPKMSGERWTKNRATLSFTPLNSHGSRHTTCAS